MAERRKKLEETAKVLRRRLTALEGRQVTDRDRPIHEVAVLAIRATLTDIGQQLNHLAIAA